MYVGYAFLAHLLRLCDIQCQDVVSSAVKHIQFRSCRFLLETREFPVVGQHIYVTPLREDLPNPFCKCLTVRHKLVLEIKDGDLCNFSAAGAHVPGGKIPNCRGGRCRIGGEGWRDNYKIVQVSVDRGLRT